MINRRYLEESYNFLEKVYACEDAKKVVGVHCVSGINCSGAIACAAMMIFEQEGTQTGHWKSVNNVNHPINDQILLESKNNQSRSAAEQHAKCIRNL